MIDPWLGTVPSLGSVALQQKMIARRRGGYCFEQNTLLRAGLVALGFSVTSLQARVVRNLPVDAPRPALHMILSVDLPEGRFLADVGFGNLAPTTALQLVPGVEQHTPHEIMRITPLGDELLLEADLAGRWEHIYRVVQLPRVDAEYEIANWWAATHPDSVFANNLIAARPGPARTRLTLFNDRLAIRYPSGDVSRQHLSQPHEFRDALADLFGLVLSDQEIGAISDGVARKGTIEPVHPSFA